MEIGKLIGMSVKNNSPNMLINFYPEKKRYFLRENDLTGIAVSTNPTMVVLWRLCLIGSLDMSGADEKLQVVLEGYSNFLREKKLALPRRFLMAGELCLNFS